MPRSPDPTRARLMSAGERLFAERGIDDVSLREISRESGARNVVALQHHFTERDGLLLAILTKHRSRVGGRRRLMLDAYEASGRLERHAAALVEPLAACFHDEDGGRHFPRIFADLTNRPRPVRSVSVNGDWDDSLDRWRRMGDTVVEPLQKADASALGGRSVCGDRARMTSPHGDDPRC